MASSIDNIKIALTKEDIQNGWTEEKLRAYLIDRENQKLDFDRKNEGRNGNVKFEGVTKFDPHSWLT